MAKFESQRVFYALQQEHPGESCVKIASRIGISHTSVSKLNRGIGIGKDAAKYLAKKNPKWEPLLDEVLKESRRRQLQGVKKRWANEGKSVNPIYLLPSKLQAFVGYTPMRSR